MPIISRPPKQGAATSYAAKVALGFTDILASEVDADFDTLFALVNGQLDSTNLAAGAVTATQMAAASVGAAALQSAAVGTSNLIDGSVTNAKVAAAAAIAGSKLAVGAAVNAITSAILTSASAFTAETTIATLNLTVRGGWVAIGGTGVLYAGSPTNLQARVRVKVDGTAVEDVTYPVNDASAGGVIPLPLPFGLYTLAAGARVITVTAAVSSGTGNLTVPASNQGRLYAVELS